MRTLEIEAPAKINLFLEVLGRRRDGYHQLATVMHAVDLTDRLTFRKRLRGFRLKGAERIPGTNLIETAYRELSKIIGKRPGLEVVLDKRIPIGAGLGGGSSNAAATLVVMRKLFDLDLDLQPVAERIGSDVPFFLHQGTALCLGRGEVVIPLRFSARLHAVIGDPGFSCSTAKVYRRLRNRLTVGHKDVNTFLKILSRGEKHRIGTELFNRLEAPSFEMFPALSRLKATMNRHGFLGVAMSGSGSCLFGLCRSRHHARSLAQRCAGLFLKTFIVQSYKEEDSTWK